MITKFRLVTEIHIPNYIELKDIIEDIKSDKYLNIITSILNTNDKAKIKELKTSLPIVCFNGKFSKKGDDYFIESSGLICLDFDKIPDDEFNKIKSDLLKWKYTHVLFTTPSGKGLKVVVKTPVYSKDDFYKYWNSLQDSFYDNDYFDQNVKGLSHGHFLTYDPNIFVNENSLVWTKKKEITYNSVKHEVFFPIEDEQRKIDFIENCFDEHFIDGNRNNYCFKKAKFFNKLGISKETCYNHLINVCQINNDFTEHELNTCIKQGYSNRDNFGTYLLEDKKKEEKILGIRGKFLKPAELRKFCDENDTDISKVNALFEKLDTRIDNGVFWTENKNGNIIHSPFEYKVFLEKQGFRKVKIQEGDYVFVKVDENIIFRADTKEIKDLVLNHIININANKVYGFYANNNKFFSEEHIDQVETIKPKIKEDTKDVGYIYFKNKVLMIGKDFVCDVEYKNIDAFIWKERIIQREYNYNDNIGIFEDFIKCISGNEKTLLGIETAIGYLMHSFKAPSVTKMISFTDKTTDTDPQGRTGKSLIGWAVSQMKNVVRIDGKNWKQDSQFLFSGITDATQVFFVDDANKNFDFEKMFSVITSSIQVERKGKDPITIDFEKAPKFMCSSNYVFGGLSDSYKDRKAEYEIERFFNADYKPIHKYGREFWSSDFTQEDWDCFNTYMVKCLQKYLTHGLIVPLAETIKRRAFVSTIKNESLCNFLQMDGVILMNKFLRVKELTNEFNKWVGDNTKEHILEKTMAKAIRTYAAYLGKKYKDGVSNGLTYIDIIDESEPVIKNETKQLIDDDFPF